MEQQLQQGNLHPAVVRPVPEAGAVHQQAEQREVPVLRPEEVQEVPVGRAEGVDFIPTVGCMFPILQMAVVRF